MEKIDLAVVNDQEIRLITGERNILKGARALQKMGSKFVIDEKRGARRHAFRAGLVRSFPRPFRWITWWTRPALGIPLRAP